MGKYCDPLAHKQEIILIFGDPDQDPIIRSEVRRDPGS